MKGTLFAKSHFSNICFRLSSICKELLVVWLLFSWIQKLFRPFRKRKLHQGFSYTQPNFLLHSSCKPEPKILLGQFGTRKFWQINRLKVLRIYWWLLWDNCRFGCLILCTQLTWAASSPLGLKYKILVHRFHQHWWRNLCTWTWRT